MLKGTRIDLFTMLVCAWLPAFVTGCGSAEGPAEADSSGTDATPAVADAEHEHEAEHNLNGWWCVEHGVPESECALCNPDLIAQFKADGDWCEEHNRPESQCFLCDPARFEVFAARYEARFGERPPEPTE